MLEIVVHDPIKTADRYEFRYTTREQRSLRSRLRRPRRTRTHAPAGSYTFGFRALNFAIDHHEVWDGFYALYYLTRNGGPLYEVGPRRASIRIEYPIASAVRDYFVQRASDFGLSITVEAETDDILMDRPTSGDVLALGGGKDSRMLLGVMREIGLDPKIITSGAENTVGIEGVLITEPVNGLPGRLADRVMPSIMALGRDIYIGTGIGEAHLVRPWQQGFDVSSDFAFGQQERLFVTLGMPMGFHAPASVLPYNLIQKILHDRYPELYAGQVSVKPESGKEKNLCISLLKIAHDLPFEDHCSEPLFRKLLGKFVRRQVARPDQFGYHGCREVINREMRAIIWRKRDEQLFDGVRDQVPADWEGAWIDYIHTYVSPRLDPRFLEVYRHYAPTVDEAPEGVVIHRIPV